MKESVLEKLKILAESAKYDVSCASSGTSRSGKKGELGSAAGWGICHSFTEDGRCISLLKIMLTNNCMYDCAYCINRRSNDVPRTTLSVSELVELTIEFYRRNYIEGLFLSSGVVRNPDYTMERLVRVVKDLRLIHRFHGLSFCSLFGIFVIRPDGTHGLYAAAGIGVGKSFFDLHVDLFEAGCDIARSPLLCGGYSLHSQIF